MKEGASFESKIITVQENGHQFLVNLTDYLDTGLFLDHRITRQMVAEEVKDKIFLNLFSCLYHHQIGRLGQKSQIHIPNLILLFLSTH